MNIQALIAAVALALTVGFGVGYYTKGKLTDAQEVTALRKDTKQTATSVVESVKQSAALDSAVVADSAQIDTIKTAATARVAKYQPKPEQHNEQRLTSGSDDGLHRQQSANRYTQAAELAAQVDCRSAGLVLDAGTVRLLNAARQGAALDSAGLGDGEKPAAPSTGR